MKNVSESGREAFQRGRFFHRKGKGERSFKNKKSHDAQNQNFNFRGHGKSKGRSHRGYSNWRNNNANIQCYNCKSLVILLQIVLNTNLKIRISTLLRKKLIMKNLHYCWPMENLMATTLAPGI